MKQLPLLLLCSVSSVCGAEVSLWMTHTSNRALPHDEPRPLLEPVIHAARGEWECVEALFTARIGIGQRLERLAREPRDS